MMRLVESQSCEASKQVFEESAEGLCRMANLDLQNPQVRRRMNRYPRQGAVVKRLVRKVAKTVAG
jgi:hypothetical protein